MCRLLTTSSLAWSGQKTPPRGSDGSVRMSGVAASSLYAMSQCLHPLPRRACGRDGDASRRIAERSVDRRFIREAYDARPGHKEWLRADHSALGCGHGAASGPEGPWVILGTPAAYHLEHREDGVEAGGDTGAI